MKIKQCQLIPLEIVDNDNADVTGITTSYLSGLSFDSSAFAVIMNKSGETSLQKIPLIEPDIKRLMKELTKPKYSLILNAQTQWAQKYLKHSPKAPIINAFPKPIGHTPYPDFSKFAAEYSSPVPTTKTANPTASSQEATGTRQKSAAATVSGQKEKDLRLNILLSLGFDQHNPNHTWVFIWAENQPISTFAEFLVLALIQRVRSFLDQVAIEELDSYLASTDLAKIIFDLDKKSKIVQIAIDKGLKNYSLTEGPLTKNQQTLQIEAILNQMATSDPQDFTIVFQARGAYVLTFGTEVIDLSLLLKHADLSQLQLRDDTVLALVTPISEFLGFTKTPLGDEVLSRLSQSHRQCLAYYTNINYNDVNSFFRGEKTTTPFYWQFFIIGCVITDAINRLPILLDNKDVFIYEKAVLHKIEMQAVSDFRSSYGLPIAFLSDIKTEVDYSTMLKQALARKIISHSEYSMMQSRRQYQRLLPLFGYNSFVRRENLTSDDALRQVTKDSCTTPSLTSTSFGMEAFIQCSHRVVFKPLRTVSIFSLSRYSHEKEVLLPPGLRVSYASSSDDNHYLVATIQRSPKDYNAYWPEHALSYALEHHLNKEYKDQSDTREIGGITVHRAYHGLPHNYRVMEVLPLLVIHFSNHAKDQAFKITCRSLNEESLNWLQIAAVFSIAGRESEVSFSENPERYMKYREACAQHFLDYVKTASPVPGDDQQRSLMIDRLQEIIHYMGNPHYETQINQHPDPEERSLRNHLHRLLSLAHKIDLPRCYSYEQYSVSVASYYAMVIQSARETSDWNAIQHYVSSLIRAQGDRCFFSINPDGSVENNSRNYQPHFGQMSTSLSALSKVSELVSKPKIRPLHWSSSSTPSMLGIFSQVQGEFIGNRASTKQQLS